MFTRNRRYIRIANPAYPQRVLVRLSKDSDPGARWAVASNTSTPIDVLEALLEDRTPFVAEQAQKTLNVIKPLTAT